MLIESETINGKTQCAVCVCVCVCACVCVCDGDVHATLLSMTA